MERALIRSFATRPWAEVQEAKRDWWARQYRDRGAAATLESSHALFEHARLVRPGFPAARDVAADLAHHVELKRQIDMASRALALR
jgi:hypothetical protein